MTCPSCEVSIEADFPAPRLARLPVEHQRFIEMFVLASGNLKAIAEQAGCPTPPSARGSTRSSTPCAR